jgi:DNA-binding transcriptional LysR family regulator
MDRLEAISAFVTVAELRGFAPAARKLGLSRPKVTRLVAALEGRLGARLLQRTTRRVALTDAGARFLDRARRLLADLSEAEALARADRSEPGGRFVLAAPTLFGRMHVAPLFSAFLARHAAVTGELLLADRVIDLVEEGVDAAVRIGPLADSSLIARRIGHTRRVVVAAPRYLEEHGAPRRPEDLPAHAIIHHTGTGAAPEWRFLRDGAEVRVPVAPRFATNSGDAAIGHAERGGGLALVLAYQVADALRAGRLRVVLPGFEPPQLPIHVVYPSAHLLSAKVKAFVELVARRAEWEFDAA